VYAGLHEFFVDRLHGVVLRGKLLDVGEGYAPSVCFVLVDLLVPASSVCAGRFG